MDADGWITVEETGDGTHRAAVERYLADRGLTVRTVTPDGSGPCEIQVPTEQLDVALLSLEELDDADG